MFAAEQPPEPPAAIRNLISADSRFVTVTQSDIPLVLTKGKPVQTERAWARYQIYIKSEVTGLDAVTDQDCRWKFTAFLQRQLCFASMTGQFGCTAASLTELAEVGSGNETLDRNDLCNTGHPAVMRAERRFSTAISAQAQTRFESDLKLSLIPTLTRTGVKVARVPPARP